MSAVDHLVIALARAHVRSYTRVVDGRLVRVRGYDRTFKGVLGSLAGRVQQSRQGFTYRTVNKSQPHSGYVVSPYPQRTKKVKLADLSEDVLDAFCRDNDDLLSKPDHYLGAWVDDDGTVWLDVSIRTKSRSAMAAIGRKFNQVAAYDLARGLEIQLGGTGEAVA